MFTQTKSLAQLIGFIVASMVLIYGGLILSNGGATLQAMLDEMKPAPAPSSLAAPANQSVMTTTVPLMFNYQGFLRDDQGRLIENNQYTMTFRIYESLDSPTALFAETHPGVLVRDGIFGVTLGSITPLPAGKFANGEARYVGVTVAPYQEMQPRQRLVGSPYALQAEHAANAANATNAANADSLGGLPAGVLNYNGEDVGMGANLTVAGTAETSGDLSVGGNLTVGGDITNFTVSPPFWNYAVGYYQTIPLVSAQNSICFLTGFEASQDYSGCKINNSDDSQWQLTAEYAACSATCLSW